MTSEYEFYAEDDEESFEFYEDFSNNKQLNNELVEACGRKGILPMRVQEGINEGVLGMTATKYKKTFGIKEPFNDNLTERQVATKNVGIILATDTIRHHTKSKVSNSEGNAIGKRSGIRAKLIFTSPEVAELLNELEKKVESLS